jgi:hypothetical protein
LIQHAQGYVATICNGTQTVAEDNFTGEMPGTLL